MVSALLGFMAISGLFGQRNLLRLQVHGKLVTEAYAGYPAQYQLELVNHRKYLPAFLIRVAFGAEETLFPMIAAGERGVQTLVLTLPERGLRPLPEVRISSCFPINFFVRSRLLPNTKQILVYPRPLKTILPASAAENIQARRDDRVQPGNDGELRSIDNYRDGDPIKAIHWKHSARLEEYKVKRHFRQGAPAQLLDPADFPGQLEEQLGRCAYLVNQLGKQQRAVGLRLNRQLIPPAVGNAHRLRILTELALYDRR